MKKFNVILATCLTVFLFSVTAKAQYEQGQSDINLGIGFAPFGLNGSSTVPPISVSYEYGIKENISVGGYFGYTASESVAGAYTSKFTYMIIGARGSYHHQFVDNIDTYAGAMLGFNMANISYEPALPAGFPEPSAGGFTYSVFIGGRYHFTDNLGAFAEIGYGISAINLGLTYKF